MANFEKFKDRLSELIVDAGEFVLADRDGEYTE